MDVRRIPSEIDLRLSLLYGDSMTSADLLVKPLTIREIKEIGYKNYSTYLNLLTIDKKELVKNDPRFDNLSLLDIIIVSQSEELIESFINAIATFLREDTENLNDNLLINETGIIFNGKNIGLDHYNIISNDNFNDLVQILKYQNCLIDPSENYEVEEENLSPKIRQIRERLKKGKEAVQKVKQQKNQGSENIDFSDIVSAVSTKSNTYNKQNVWDLTIYQLYDEYKRLEAISSYETSIMAMIQGAKIDDLKHWSAKIE